MTNEQLIKKMKEDMKMRGFSHWTEESYLGKTKDIIKYFRKPLEEVTIEELRNFLLKYLREERKLSERSVNYYNSVIRFIYEVTLDKLINKKQLPMYRKRRKMKDVLTKEELSTFFNACENYMYKTIFMMIYGSGLRVSEAETLQELAEDKKYLGGEIGFFSILHTWGQNLMYHPHIHCVVTGGGLTELGKWVEKEEDFFIPVKVMSRKFRGKFLSYMKETKLDFYGKNKELENPAIYNELIQSMYNKEWVVYCKERFKNAESVIKYLGRYTHRVAISNERIIKIEDNKVTFKWRDYKDNNKMKEMTVTIEEFIRRFLIHILPPRFMKIRYYGILGNKSKKKKLLKCKILTRTKIYKKKELPTLELLKKVLGKDFNLCPHCKKGHMLIPNTT